MPIEVEGPDGNVYEFPDNTPRDVMKSAMQKRFSGAPAAAKQPAADTPDVGVDSAKGFARGFNEGVDALLSAPGAIMNAASNLADLPMDLLGLPRLEKKWQAPPVTFLSSANDGQKPQTTAGRYSQAVGEVIGSGIIPEAGMIVRGAKVAPNLLQLAVPKSQTISAQTAARPLASTSTSVVSGTGAGVGVGAARDAELGPTGEFAAGLAAGVAAPYAFAGAARTAGSIKSAADYGKTAVQNARNPEQAAVNTLADNMVKSGLSPDDIRDQIAPKTSTNLTQRGFTRQDISDIVMRQMQGEPAEQVAKDYANLVDDQGRAFTADTARKYYRTYVEANPTPVNIIDIAKTARGDGAAQPLARLGRATMGIADDADAAQALTNRQMDQAGRVQGIINRSVGGDDFETRIAQNNEVLTKQAREAYAKAEAESKPFDLRPEIAAARDLEFRSAGDIKTGLKEAIDLFYEPALIAGGKGEGAFPVYTKLGTSISDLKRYQGAREALDQKIAASMKDGRPTPLTAALTRFRKSINAKVREANPALAKADDLFSGAKSNEKILEAGANLTTKIGSDARDSLRLYNSLTNEQKELFRIGFARKMMDMASNIRDGAGVANQFSTPGFRRIVSAIYRGDKATTEAGRRLVRDLQVEAATTRTKNDLMAGSRTAEYASDMNNMMAGAKTGADILTARWGKVLENLANRLSLQIGERASREVLKLLLETDPPKILQNLTRLSQAAKTSAERQAYVAAIREFRKPQLSKSQIGGTGAVALDRR